MNDKEKDYAHNNSKNKKVDIEEQSDNKNKK